MSFRHRAALGASLVAFALLAGPALAVPAVLIGTEGFLSGPGGDYNSLGSLDKGDHVDVIWCGAKGNWCLVEMHGKKGWVPLASLNTRPGGGGSTDDSGGNGKGGGATRNPAMQEMATEISPGNGGGGGPKFGKQGSGITSSNSKTVTDAAAMATTIKPKP